MQTNGQRLDTPDDELVKTRFPPRRATKWNQPAGSGSTGPKWPYVTEISRLASANTDSNPSRCNGGFLHLTGPRKTRRTHRTHPPTRKVTDSGRRHTSPTPAQSLPRPHRRPRLPGSGCCGPAGHRPSAEPARPGPAPQAAQAGQLGHPAAVRPGLFAPEPAPCLTRGNKESEVLFTLIAEDYERRSLGITSNLLFLEWARICANSIATAAANEVNRQTNLLKFVKAG